MFYLINELNINSQILLSKLSSKFFLMCEFKDTIIIYIQTSEVSNINVNVNHRYTTIAK